MPEFNKSAWIIDTPNGCKDCKLLCSVAHHIYVGYKCMATEKEYKAADMPKSRPEECPLKPLKEEGPTCDSYEYEDSAYWEDGWNACIKYLRGDEDEQRT